MPSLPSTLLQQPYKPSLSPQSEEPSVSKTPVLADLPLEQTIGNPSTVGPLHPTTAQSMYSSADLLLTQPNSPSSTMQVAPQLPPYPPTPATTQQPSPAPASSAQPTPKP